MSKDEWYEKLCNWAHDDERLHRLPYIFLMPLAEHIASVEAVEHSVQRTADDDPQPGSLDYWAAVTSKNSGDDRPR